jgi:hypothetical protein
MPGSQARLLPALLLLALLAGCAGNASRCGDSRCYDDKTAIPGTGDSSGGSAHYRIDIALPPGRNGMSPSVSISASSRDGNSLLGEAWSLSATSSLYRCGARLLEDGYSAGSDYQGTDKLCLDGAHLLAYRGQYGRSGTLYRTRSDDFLQVREFGDLQDPDVYFVVTTQDDVRWVYKEAEVQDGAKYPLAWFMSYKEDTVGNAVSYSYIHSSPGNLLISEIRYTGQERGGRIEPGTRWVRFNYEARPDTYGGHLNGAEGLINQRLASIATGMDVEVDGKQVERPLLEYGLSYRQSANSGRSLLTTVRECAYETTGARYCRIPTMFTWLDSAVRYADPKAYDPSMFAAIKRSPWQQGVATPEVAPYSVSHDYDGDGRDEIVFFKAGVAAHLFDVDIHGTLLHDVDLDRYIQQPSAQWVDAMGSDMHHLGGAEVVGETGGFMSFAPWKGSTVGEAEKTDIPWSPDLVIGGFNGVGSSDVLESQVHGDKYVVTYYVDHGTSVYRTHFSAAIEILRLPLERDPGRRLWLKITGGLEDNSAPDVLVMSGKSIKKIILFRQNADGTPGFRAVNPADYGISDRAQSDGISFADIDADGKEDIVYSEGAAGVVPTWHYQINTGHGFAQPADTGVPDGRGPQARGTATIVADIAADGHDAIIYPDKLLADYCLPLKTPADADDGYECSSTGLDRDDPDLDLGIYRYAALKFDMRQDGTLVPVLLQDTNIVAQAHLASAGDLQGDGLVDFLSPFDPWFSNGRFRTGSSTLDLCPEQFGCGLHVSSSVLAQRDDRMNAAPDMMVRADHGDGRWESWNYYPLSSARSGFYSIPAPDSPDRFVDPYSYFFSTAMYVVGDFTQNADTVHNFQYSYGGGIYNGAEGFFEGFRWVEVHDLDNGVKYVNWFDQTFPFADDELRASWSERESAQGDDLLHGIPGRHYISETAYEVDCQGPADSMFSVRMHCVDAESPTYHQFTRSVVTTSRNAVTGDETVTRRENYDYDLFDHRVHSVVPQSDGSLKVTDSLYAPPDLENWWVDRLQRQRITTIQNPREAHDKTTDKLISDITYQYGADRLISAEIIIKPEYGAILREMYSYEDDQVSASFGNLKSIDGAVLEDDGSYKPIYRKDFSYTPDGYFLESEVDSISGTSRFEYDSATGKLLTRIDPDGKKEQHHYDLFGDEH